MKFHLLSKDSHLIDIISVGKFTDDEGYVRRSIQLLVFNTKIEEPPGSTHGTTYMH